MSTKIEWAEESWNPIVGCKKISAGCANCYAEAGACSARLQQFPKYRAVTWNNQWNGEVFFDKKALVKPLHWKKPRRIFVCSMGDLFYEGVPFWQIDNVFDITKRCRQHEFLILTKRPWLMYDYFDSTNCRCVDGAPFENIRIGTTIENRQAQAERIPKLVNIPCKNFISCEPLLESLDLKIILPFLNWVIVGCESGINRRPCKLEWVRDIVRQCRAANVPVFVKQLDIGGQVVKDIEEFPEELKIREYPDN